MTPSFATDWAIRSFVPSDQAAVLRLNAENQPALAPVNAADLAEILACGGHIVVATDPVGEVVGFLLSFPSVSAYDDSEINALRRLIPEAFLYICQVAVAALQRGKGLGRALYVTIDELAQQQGLKVICCDVNLAPANPASLAFHRQLGFTPLVEGKASNGFEIVFLVRRCTGAN